MSATAVKVKAKEKAKASTTYRSTPAPQARDETDAVKAATDALLDEIDSVLENNPMETLRRFRQRGGQ